MEIKNNILIKVYPSDIQNGIVVIPKNIKIINDGSFDGGHFDMSELTHIVVSKNVECIKSMVFSNCPCLKTCIIENPNCFLREMVFYNCGLEKIRLPQNLKEILEPTFCFLYNLEILTIPNSVPMISLNYFQNTLSLKKLVWRENIYTYQDLIEYQEIY